MASTYHLRICPSKGLTGLKLREFWSFRGLLAALAIRDIKLRYRQTVLGVAWVVFQPLLASGILAFVFGTVAEVTKPGRSSVFIFVLGGFVGWSLFSSIFVRSGQSLIQNSGLITKVFFPRLILPAATVVSALLDTGVSLLVFIILTIALGPAAGLEILTLPIWLALLLMFAFGLGLINAALSVRFRDVQHITPVLLQILFYASPVAYQTGAVPDKWRGLFLLNPLAPLFEGLRWSLLREGDLRGLQVVYALLVCGLTLLLGLMVFHHAEREFADLI
ncbi:MAG TPA: ABC transporter permease [Chthoniobacterales bacterium]|jgi:lipopolysaccharide transport system permease protein|nr:ABC transporter permease [Verrucomicrobiota bacterium]HTD16833.1 ABC transporter permease [Chthoniobacterales bacterium]